jgi:uncharacterized protein YjeT (DUF2065 family)
MNWGDLLAGIAIYLVLEGMLPFLTPQGWRRGLLMVAQLADGQLRVFGLASMLAGLVLLLVVRGA